jgi:hypothetical protein
MAGVPLFWLAMTYQCEGCGYEMEFLLEMGCEGPKAHVKWVPVPFNAGPCPECVAADREMAPPDYGHKGPPPGPPPPPRKRWPHLQHVRWNEDRTLYPLVRGPLETPHFRFPNKRELRLYGDQACGVPVYAEAR